jgi:hypothetical protein
MNTDDPDLHAVAAEVSAQGPMECVFQPATVLELTGLIQLALRHPGLSDPLRDSGARFLHAVRVYFGDCPAVLELVARGDDPTFDT